VYKAAKVTLAALGLMAIAVRWVRPDPQERKELREQRVRRDRLAHLEHQVSKAHQARLGHPVYRVPKVQSGLWDL
jgi:hypothetical protein